MHEDQLTAETLLIRVRTLVIGVMLALVVGTFSPVAAVAIGFVVMLYCLVAIATDIAYDVDTRKQTKLFERKENGIQEPQSDDDGTTLRG
jgi:hypothetical protein